MRIHTTATAADVRQAAQLARVSFDRFSEHGSRKSARAFDVTLTGESRRRPNRGSSGAGDDYAATWDQWGVFLAAIFDADPWASCWAYDDAATFHKMTSDRFRGGWPSDAHGDHSWVIGEPGVQECRKCSARQVR